MNDQTDIDNILDNMFENKTSRQETEQLLTQHNITNVAHEIDLHIAAAKALQRYMVLEQVRLVHEDYVMTFQVDGDKIKLVTQNRTVRIMNRVMRIAAVLLVVVGLVVGYMYATTNSSSMYEKIYQPYFVNTDRGYDDDTFTYNIVNEFKAGNYEAVIKSYQALPIANSREKFLAGYAYHQTGQYEPAIELLNGLLVQNKLANARLYNDESEFYLALSYLKMNDISSALRLFQHIAKTPAHTFHESISDWTLTRLRWLQ